MRLSRRFGLLASGAVFALSVGGCAGGDVGGEAPGSSPLFGLAKTLDLATDVPEPKPFVVKSRPASGDPAYIPVHERPAARPEAVLTPEGLKQRERELEAVRRQHDRIAGRPATAAATPAARPVATRPAAPTQVKKPAVETDN